MYSNKVKREKNMRILFVISYGLVFFLGANTFFIITFKNKSLTKLFLLLMLQVLSLFIYYKLLNIIQKNTHISVNEDWE